MTSPILSTNLFDNDDADANDTEDIYEEDKTLEVSVMGLHSMEELFTMITEDKAGSRKGVRDTDDNIVGQENTTDSNSNETNSVFNRKVKLRPSRPLKHKNVSSASRDSLSDTLDGSSKSEPEFVSADNFLKNHFQEKTDLTLRTGSNCEISTLKASDILRKSGQSMESAYTNTIQKIEEKSLRIVKKNSLNNKFVRNRKLVVGEEFLDSQQKVIDDLRNQNKMALAKEEKLRTELGEKEHTILKLKENRELLMLELKKARQCLIVSEDNLSSTIAEKEKVLISHQNLVKEHVTYNEVVQRKLLQREELIDSHQRVFDDLESLSVNAHKVEKLENELCEKEKVILKLKEDGAEITCKVIEIEKVTKNEIQRCEDLGQQFMNLEMDKQEKEKEILVEREKAQRKTSEEILKTVKALKIKIDDILISEDEDRIEIKNLQDRIASLSLINKGLEEQVDSLKANQFTKSGETEVVETALREKKVVCVELERKISDLKEKLQETKKTLDKKTLQVAKMESENGKAKHKLKCMEKDMKAVIREKINLQNKLGKKVAEISLLNEQGAQSKSELKEVKERLDLETDKTIKLIKKLNSLEKLMSIKVKDVEILTDQKIHLENEVKALQSVVDEHRKNVKLLSEANLMVKYLEDEKRDLLKEVRNVSDLQKRIRFLEAETKKLNNLKLNDVEEQGTPGSLKKTTVDNPDLKDIDAILKRISYNDIKHIKSVAAKFCGKDSAKDSSLLREASIKSSDTGRLNIITTAEETPAEHVSRVTEVHAMDEVVMSGSKSSHKRDKSAIETDLDSEDDKREMRRHKSKKSKKIKIAKSKNEEYDRGRESKRHRERSMLSCASRSRSREKFMSRYHTKVKSSSRSRSKSRIHREKNCNTRRISSRPIGSPSCRERIRKVPEFSDNKQKSGKSPSFPKKSGTLSTSSMSQGLQPRSKPPFEVKDAEFALSEEIRSIMEKLKGTKAVPLSIKIEDTDSACNTVKEAIETLPSQPITNIVANYSSELDEISDEELTLAENCENDEEQTENNCELLVGFLKKMG